MKTNMTLGKLIEELEKLPSDKAVYFDFAYFVPTALMSWRGDYTQLALGYSEDAAIPTVHQLLTQAKAALKTTFTGYKGGYFEMHEDTKLRVANCGSAGSTIVTHLTETYCVIINTAFVEYVDTPTMTTKG